MSKERLEEFREFIDFMYESIEIEDRQRFIAISDSMLKDGWFKWIYRYAKEHAERVQELRMFQKHTESLAGEIAELEHEKEHLELIKERQEEEYRNIYKQNKRYREILTMIATDDSMTYRQVVDLAIEALEGDPHESS